MEVNAKGRTKIVERKTVENPEGSLVFERSPEIQLYLEASNLNIKSDKFYQSAKDKLQSVIDKAKTADEDYVAGLAKFLADNGLKLSPVVLMSTLSDRKHNFDGSEVYIFNTPQRIAEAVSLSRSKKREGYFNLNNSFKKNVLKVALQNMSEFTLRKNRLENRKVKLRDLIKLLRPRPKDERYAKLYKAIIEGDATSKLKDKESLVSVKSSKNLSDEEKNDYFKNNLDVIPINQLIRNLKMSEGFRFAESHEIQKKVIDRMKKVDDNTLRYINIFDLIEVAVHVPSLDKAMFEVVDNFVNKLKKEAGDPGKATILFDVSGSMEGEGIENGFKYLVVMTLLYDVDIYVFSDSLDTRNQTKLIKYIKSGQLLKAHEELEDIFHAYGRGTALVDSVRLASEKELVHKTLIVVSDEVSWREGEDLRGSIEEAGKLVKNKKLVVINPQVYQGTVFRENVMAIASLTSSILHSMYAFTKPEQFVKYLRTYKNGTKTSDHTKSI